MTHPPDGSPCRTVQQAMPLPAAPGTLAQIGTRRMARAELGEQFEEIEHRTFGKDGYADAVKQVVQVEHHVGMQSLDAYTPREPTKESQ